jgi:arsenite/tail-anchored protein-transporting ATPase
VPSLDFFIGKGGVGKTTISSAYAARVAAQRRGRVLLLSTDPAHSLFDVFALRSARERQRVKISGRASLDVWQLDAEREFAQFLDEYRDAVLDVIASGTIFSREEVAPLLDSTIPGMAEVSALLVLAGLIHSRKYDRIVVDTAPLGHTLRLFELPEAFRKLLRFLQIAASRDQVLAQRFARTNIAGPAFLKEWEKKADEIRGALAGPESNLVLVTTPEDFALYESMRAKRALAESFPPLSISEIVLNRAITNGGDCQRCAKIEKSSAAAKTFLRRNFPRSPVHMAEDVGAPIEGVASLLAFGEHIFDGKRLKLTIPRPKVPDVGFKRVQWPALSTPLSLSIGKGGVGKTTISAALSYLARQRDPETPLTICSTDPAPSLDDVFRQPVGDRAVPVLRDPKFRAMEMDAAAEFDRWTSKVKDKLADAFGGTSGNIHVDLSFEREVITALLDMVPPGMDELAATFRILDLLEGDQRVVIDMAPTGHALELLRMPERIQLWTRLILRALAPHRELAMAQEAGVEIARVGQHVRELARSLHDAQRCHVYVVMLPEPLPDRETGRLVKDLNALDVALGPVFVNRVLLTGNGGCDRCERVARFQSVTLARLRRQDFGTLLAVPEQAGHPAGVTSLKKLTRELWRIE